MRLWRRTKRSRRRHHRRRIIERATRMLYLVGHERDSKWIVRLADNMALRDIHGPYPRPPRNKRQWFRLAQKGDYT